MLSATKKEHQGMTVRIWYEMRLLSANNVIVLQPIANAKLTKLTKQNCCQKIDG